MAHIAITGNALNNNLIGGANHETINGLAGNDCLFGNGAADVLNGGLGNDTLNGGAGPDVLNGGAGIDTASYLGGPGVTVNLALVVQPGAGFDNLFSIENLVGSNFGDSLIGNAGNNQLCGAAGADTLNGMGGNDVLNGGLGGDVLNGGAGIDTADYSNKSVCGVPVPGATGPVKVDLNIAIAQNTVGSGFDMLLGIENVTGTNFTGDLLIGDAGSNVLLGLAGNDILKGGGGNDTLNGGSGNDRLTGGVGLDTLVGGAGNDIFDYNAASESPAGAATRDVIIGFAGNGAGVGDQIDLSRIDANASVAGNQAFTAVQLTYFGGILSANIIGTAPAPDLQIQLSGAPPLVLADIIL